MKKILLLATLFGLFIIDIPFATADLSDGLVAHYPFNGNANDETGNGYNGNVSGATLTEDREGNPNSAYSFDGSFDYIDIGTSLNFPCYPTYAVSTWFLNNGGAPQTNGYGQKIMAKATFFNDFWLSVYTSGHPEPYTGMFYWQQYTGIGGGPKGVADTNYNYMDSQWHHMVVNRNGGFGELWIDGVSKGKVSTLTDVCNSQHLMIGYTDHPDSLQRLEGHWNGKIDDIYIYDRTLTEAEIQELYVGDIAVSCDPDTPGAIIGTSGDDGLIGTPGDDVIIGLEGNDSIVGRGGNDCIAGGVGADRIIAGAGNDEIDGGPGNDRIIGARGDDRILAGEGNDTVVAGSGDDVVEGGQGNDRIIGGSGNDDLDGGSDSDLIIGGSGTDTCANGELVLQCE